MAVLYLMEQNVILRKSGDRILFCKRPSGKRRSPGLREGDILMEWPCEDVDHVMVFGNIQITTQALHQLLSHGVETAIFTLNGKLLGQLTPPGGKNILLRQKQYEKYGDNHFVPEFSKSIVKLKIMSMLNLLNDHHKNYPETITGQEIADIQNTMDNIENEPNLDSLRGIEGAASAKYFGLLGRMLTDEWDFSMRSRRPPKDEPNAVLSFGYTIVGSELRSLLDGVGFDPFLGYYHQVHYGRPSLALDILEIFRHCFIDRLMIRLFNLSILTKDDFNQVGKGGVYLSKSGKGKFFTQYEQMVGQYKGESMTQDGTIKFRKHFQNTINSLMKTVMNDEPFVPQLDL